MKTKVILILILIVVLIVLSLGAMVFVGGYGGEVEVSEQKCELEHIHLGNPCEWAKPTIEPEISTDVMFTYIDEELTLNIIDGEIVCSRPAEKAIEIIFKSLYVGYNIGPDTDINDLPVRFPGPNEPTRPPYKFQRVP